VLDELRSGRRLLHMARGVELVIRFMLLSERIAASAATMNNGAGT
jgi:hypothetical protein